MSHEITRLFATAAAAEGAAAELREEGFDDVFVVIGSASKKAGRQAIDDIALQIARGSVLMADARIYAEGVTKGGSLVTVHAPFGSGAAATSILESFEPIDSGMPPAEPEIIWDEAAPLSSALHMPLLSDDPAPLSRMWNVAPLAGSNSFFSALIGLPLLTESDGPGESRWGLPFLSNNPAPLSSMLGLPVLKKESKSW